MVLIMALLPNPSELGSGEVDQAGSASTEKAEHRAKEHSG
jgi:hypothetical protein